MPFKGRWKNRGRMIQGSHLLRFLIVLSWILLLGFSLQGCTLLFVAKGETRYVENKPIQFAPVPSLSRQMDKTIVLNYKVQEGDSFNSIAVIYYGEASKAKKVAKANHLSLKT